MKIEKTPTAEGIRLHTNTLAIQTIFFDTEQERDIVFAYWCKAIVELEESKAIYRPVYEKKDGDIQILKLRYTTQEEVIEVERKRNDFFGGDKMKLVMIYNEAERTFEKVNF
jgi:hypothetical protein